jgi:hypothetical protein
MLTIDFHQVASGLQLTGLAQQMLAQMQPLL